MGEMVTRLYSYQYLLLNSLRWMLKLCVAVLSLSLLSVSVSVAKRIAFVVGIDKYENLGDDKQLKNPVHDAQEMARELKKLGYEVTSGINTTRREFYTKWHSITNKITSEDTLLFFYSGHGIQIDRQNFLLPSDIPFFKFGRHTQYKSESISVNGLLNDLQPGDTRQSPEVTVMILDACREDPTVPAEYKAIGGKGGLAKILTPPQGTFIMYAASPGKVSLDRLGSEDLEKTSVYTRTLLPLLRRPNLSIQDLAIKVRYDVYKLTKSIANFVQIPEYTDGIIGRFCLAGCPDHENGGASSDLAMVPVPKVHERMKEEREAIKEPSMVILKSGDFISSSGQRIRFPRAFAIGKYEVTFAEYDQFAQATGRPLPDDEGWGRGKRPAINISWEDAKAYTKWLSKQTGKQYRLPTEAEWEYAAYNNGGEILPVKIQTKWSGTSNRSQLGNYAVFRENSGGKTAEVGSKQPNHLGFHEMSGNVWEWVEDCWHRNFAGAPTDGAVWLEANEGDCNSHVIRGGAWFSSSEYLRSSYRVACPFYIRDNFIGFRLAQDIE